MTRRQDRTQNGITQGWIVFVLVGVVAYSGLWLSERVATARTAQLLEAPARAAVSRERGSSWGAAKSCAPAGDPRRVLALEATPDAEQATKRLSGPVGDAVDTLAQVAADSSFLASGAAP